MGKKRLIAIAGGIGSGKSVVSAILRINGYSVYDCDSRAKILMNTSADIKNDLIFNFGGDCVTSEGKINTQYISSVIFNDKTALSRINSIVHPRVKKDILLEFNSCSKNIMFIESAILLQSNLLDIIDEVWLVEAPEEIRIKRVMLRNGMSAEDVKRRIESQNNQDYDRLKNIKFIINDGTDAILPQLSILMDGLNEK